MNSRLHPKYRLLLTWTNNEITNLANLKLDYENEQGMACYLVGDVKCRDDINTGGP